MNPSQNMKSTKPAQKGTELCFRVREYTPSIPAIALMVFTLNAMFKRDCPTGPVKLLSGVMEGAALVVRYTGENPKAAATVKEALTDYWRTCAGFMRPLRPCTHYLLGT